MDKDTTKEIYTLTYGESSSEVIDVQGEPMMVASGDILDKSVSIQEEEAKEVMTQVKDNVDLSKDALDTARSSTVANTVVKKINDTAKLSRGDRISVDRNFNNIVQDQELDTKDDGPSLD